MILIEQDAKRLLMERLDECLKVHADMLDAQNIGSIYELQGFSELHYYLKVEHVFTPAEVEALLSFQDPLDVARWCWEENNHEHSFPICDLLKECVRRGYGYSGKYCRNPRQPGIPVSERAGCFCPGTAAKCGSGSAGMSGCGETGTRFRCTVMGRKLYYDGRCIDALCTCTKGFNQS